MFRFIYFECTANIPKSASNEKKIVGSPFYNSISLKQQLKKK
ncbi:hypothetical protein FCR2A7T_06430 [Flavobacterium cauense R2A-7]|nr:hypothetical protein FCR2A7T_06430 [Flavobacterium cauense R2A-7]